MIDLHCHILPGIDDGPPTIEDALALARVAADCGTRIVVATPHVSWEYPNTYRGIADAVDDLNTRLRAEGIGLEVRTGAELAMTRVAAIEADELERLALGGGRWLLVEPPFTPVVTGLDSLVSQLQQRGYSVLLAHPERCMAFHSDRAILERIVAGGALTSITAGSLDGRFGSSVRRFAFQLLDDQMVHNVASDSHDAIKRPPTVLAELQRAGLESLARWLTVEVPEAILEGGEIPQRPATESSAPRRGWRRMLGKR